MTVTKTHTCRSPLRPRHPTFGETSYIGRTVKNGCHSEAIARAGRCRSSQLIGWWTIRVGVMVFLNVVSNRIVRQM
jgi:hypothetical protein